MLSTIDRVLFLKNVSLFSAIPDHSLQEIVAVLTDVEVKAGTTIFEKGDEGTCMYIIAEGRVRVHDGERTLNELGKWAVFGEMAVLDPEPRMASVTALTDMHLFRLDREPLYVLMASHVEVVQGIIHILSQYVRARVRDMVEDYKYMRQFARVTAAAAAVEAGVYTPESLDEVAQRTDQLGQLARVFQRMAREVYAREQRLIEQIQELRIEIDETRQARQVAEITETDYFQELRNKARGLRKNARHSDG